MAGLGVFVALGEHNPLLPPLGSLPLLGLLRVPARFGLLLFWGLLLAAASAALRLRSSRMMPRWAKIAALAVVLADMGPWAGKFVYAQDSRPYLSRNEAFARQIAGRPVRFVSDPDLANPNKAMLYRAMNANGYEAFYLKAYTDFILRAAGPSVLDPSRVLLRACDSEALRKLAVAWRLSREGRLEPNPGFEPMARVAGTGPVRTESLSPERWRMSGFPEASPQRLVFAMPYYPGWKAWLGGRRVEISREDGVFQAVNLPAGGSAGMFPGASWSLDFRFRPTLWPGLVLANLIAAALWLVQARRMFE
jgi:hypothetical protein